MTPEGLKLHPAETRVECRQFIKEANGALVVGIMRSYPTGMRFDWSKLEKNP